MNERSSLEKTSIKNDNNFIQKLENITSYEEKIKFSLQEMKKTLSTDNRPDFKTFWEIKSKCLLLFKYPINSIVRSGFWKEYIDLSNEEKKLKNILNEKIIFEVEQIDLAIKSIEEDMQKYDEILKDIEEIEINNKLKALQNKRNFYIEKQKEISLLNAFAAKINSLRKEIIKTTMRVSSKNKFLKRLSDIGDVIFPKRKIFVDEISEEFSKSINSFVKNFDVTRVSFFILKEDIKNMQNLAKQFTLNTESFTECRLLLSKCWDKVKLAEKSYKKERQKSKDIIAQIVQKINNLKKMCETDLDEKAIDKEEKEIFNVIKSSNLKKKDMKFLKQRIFDAKAPIIQKQQEEKEKKSKNSDTFENSRKEKLNKIKDQIVNLLQKNDFAIEELEQEKNQIEKQIDVLKLAKFERLILEKDFRALIHLIEEKKEKVALSSSDDVITIRAVFDQKKKRRQAIKNHIDNLNKQLSCSGLDFEKAMSYRDLIDAEKQKLKSLDESIKQLEDNIADLESN